MPSQYRYVKRAMDVVGAVVGLVLMAVPMALVAVAVKLDSPGPVFFRQLRMGRHSVPFVCYKFRSMYTTAPKECAANDLQDRVHMVTRVGNFLRKSSLDEVPQLWNVLKGDMSLIGPRPLILNETWINEERARRGVYELQPGITGLAQICGRNQVSDQDKVYFDEYYLTHYGMWLDVKILFGTVLYVLLGKDIL